MPAATAAVRTPRARAAAPAALRRRIRARLAEQRVLVRSLIALRAQVAGSLFTRFGRCGKAGCACAEGRGHGPYYVLSRRSGGAGSFAYLGEERVEEARALLTRSRAFRKGLRRLKQVNQELVDLLKRYPAAGARQGARRLGLLGS
jgi:hypothetical protein